MTKQNTKGLASGQVACREALSAGIRWELEPLEGSVGETVGIRVSVPVGTLCPETGNPQENLEMALTSRLFREVNGPGLGGKSPTRRLCSG